jgi:hypothetical protein
MDMQFGGVIYLHDLSHPRDVSRGKELMTPMKLSHPEIAPRVILATVDGSSSMAKHREKQLKDTTWRKLKTQQFTNTEDSVWSIVDTILGISPTGIKLSYIQDELDKICASLPKHLPKPKGTHREKLKSWAFPSSKNRDRIIKTGDRVMVDGRPTDIVIP